jgi:hypothetical protein
MSEIRARVERRRSAETALPALERGMYRGDVEGMVAEKSVRMKPIESECFVPDFLIFQMTCRAMPDE